MSSRERSYVLAGLTVAAAVLALFVLWRVIGAIVLALATAFVLLPVHRWLRRRSGSSFWSATVTTLAGFAYIVVFFLPFVIVLSVRRASLIQYIRDLPETVTVNVLDYAVAVDVASVQDVVVRHVRDIAIDIAAELPVFTARLVVFGFVLFAVLYYHADVRTLVRTTAPPEYYDLLDLVTERIREVLVGHYSLAFLGATVTYLVGLLVFTGLGYSIPFALALLAGILYLFPVVSPGYLVAALAVAHLNAGDPVAAAYIVGFGGVGLVVLPRYILTNARTNMGDPATLSSTVYFVGFVGGWLTIGLAGLVVGPLVLAVGLALLRQLEPDDWTGLPTTNE